MKVNVHNRMADIAADDWNRLAGSEYPFLTHTFLRLAEESGSVAPAQGWLPQHLSIHDKEGLRAAMPLYRKNHSWGEFVFDWAWANAYEQAGLDYYPKLVSTIPFTPATSTRLLLRDTDDREAALALLYAATGLAEETHCSSVHILFPSPADVRVLRDAGLLMRSDCQFHWHNRNYRDFDDFLATFTSRKRKKARRDRRRVHEAGIRFRHLHGDEIDDPTWSVINQLISSTFMKRGNLPYFNASFLPELAREDPARLMVVLAETAAEIVATAVFYVGDRHLYGRYWGSTGHYDALHFETCYYQGIEYCIVNDMAVFEPGTQGEHKISRGFSPVETQSAHWLAHPEFADAIENYLHQEARHVSRYMDAVDAHSPYRKAQAEDE